MLWVRAREAGLAQNQKYTLQQLFDLYRESRRIEGKNADKLDYQWKPLAPMFAHLQPSDVEKKAFVEGETRSICHAYAVKREKQGRLVRKKARDKEGRPTGELIDTYVGTIARDTIVSELSLLRTVVIWGHENGKYVTKSGKPPVVWVPPSGNGRKTSLNDTEMGNLIVALFQAPFHIRVFLIIAMSTGARKEAILELQWDRVDFVNGTIDFNRDGPRSILDTSHLKGRAIVDMSPELRETLLEAWEWRVTGCNYVVEWRGQRVHDPKEAIKTVFMRAGLGRRYMGAHALRHSIATWAIAHGIEPVFVQQLLGHKKLDTTLGSYVEHKIGSLTKAAGVISRLLQVEDVRKRNITDHSRNSDQ